MITELLGLLTALSPALCGALVGLAVAAKYSRGAPGVTAVLLGAGGLLGYVLIALFIRWQDARGVAVLTPALRQVLLVLPIVLVSLCVGLWRQPSAKLFGPSLTLTPRRAFRGLRWIFSLFICSLFISIVYQAAVSPVASWDGLGYWTLWADRFLLFDLSPEGFNGRTRAEYGAYPFQHPRHPPTVYHLSAFSGFALDGSNMFRGWLIPWNAVWLCGAMVIWGAVRELSGSTGVALLGVYAYSALPLLENHAVLVGYADFWVAILVTLAVACFTLALARGGRLMALLAVVLTLALILFKNIGVLYVLAVSLPLAVVLLGRWSQLLLTSLALIILSLVIWLYLNGFNIEIAGTKLALITGDPREVFFGGKSMVMEIYSILGILRNELWAFGVNQSFATIGLICIFSVVAAGHRGSMTCPNTYAAFLYLLFAALSLLSIFMVPQLTTSYAERYAVPASDLGGSRFLMSLGPVAILLAAVVMRFAMQGNQDHFHE